VIYAKIALAIALIGGLFWGLAADYSAGKKAGETAVQAQFDAFKQKDYADVVADLQNMRRDRDAAIANNDGAINDLNAQMDALRNTGSMLSSRLRDAEARASASGSALSKASDQLRAASGAINASLEQINGAVADTINECGANNAKYTALIRELKPQL
jgi:chromosome segregation ATPase